MWYSSQTRRYILHKFLNPARHYRISFISFFVVFFSTFFRGCVRLVLIYIFFLVIRAKALNAVCFHHESKNRCFYNIENRLSCTIAIKCTVFWRVLKFRNLPIRGVLFLQKNADMNGEIHSFTILFKKSESNFRRIDNYHQVQKACRLIGVVWDLRYKHVVSIHPSAIASEMF